MLGRVWSVAVVLSVSVASGAELYNFAAAGHGARAFSNGDFNTATEQHGPAGGIDGTRDMSRYAQDGVWMGSVYPTKEQPALWWVELAEATRVNRVRIHHLPSGNHVLVDFGLEYRDPETGAFQLVRPYKASWCNPVQGNQAKVSELTFDEVRTDGLRLVITAASPDHMHSDGHGMAYLVEFEAYLVDVTAEEAVLRQELAAVAEIGELAARWVGKYGGPEPAGTGVGQAEGAVAESEAFAWVRREKVRTAHIGFGVDYLRKLLPIMSDLGFNAIDPAGHRYASRPFWGEQVAQLDELAREAGFPVTLWFAWYWYEDSPGFEERNCLVDLTRGGDYRRAVDFRGQRMVWAPCPLSSAFWGDLFANVRQVADWSTTYKSVWGMCVDFEFYGTGQSRQSSDWYSYDFCFCDHCFEQFLTRIGSTVRAGQVPAERRFSLLKSMGALEAYYGVLSHEVGSRAQQVREMAHGINEDLVLGFYGVPISPEPNVAELLEAGPMFKSWFGQALAQAWGTQRLPCVYKPLDASLLAEGWSMKCRVGLDKTGRGCYYQASNTLQEELDGMGLHVVHIPGLVICDESPAAPMREAIRQMLDEGQGLWFNEIWMLTAFRDEPERPRPGWWRRSKDDIEAYWRVLGEELGRSPVEKQGG